jgi:hypothetical protein
MGFRFTKRVKLLPSVSLNFSKSGVTTSLGPRGAKVTIGHGKIRQTVGIPGTGISYTSSTPIESSISNSHSVTVPQPAALAATQNESGWVTAGRTSGKVLYWLTIGVFIAVGVVAVAFLAALLSGGSSSKRRR